MCFAPKVSTPAPQATAPVFAPPPPSETATAPVKKKAKKKGDQKKRGTSSLTIQRNPTNTNSNYGGLSL